MPELSTPLIAFQISLVVFSFIVPEAWQQLLLAMLSLFAFGLNVGIVFCKKHSERG